MQLIPVSGISFFKKIKYDYYNYIDIFHNTVWSGAVKPFGLEQI